MSNGKKLVVAGIWIVASLVVFMGFRWIFAPMLADKKAQQQEVDRKQVLTDTSSSSRYKHHIRFATDSFSGYAILRSEEFFRQCGVYGIQVQPIDVADYEKRLEALKSGDIQMAAFSIDALIKTSAKLGDMPGTMVAVIDESFGADSMWASKNFASLDALNDPSTKFVLVGDSPSETFVHVVRHFFELNRLGPDPFERVGNAREVIQAYRQSRPGEKKIFVTWQPEASQIASNPDYKSLMDSSRLRGYVMDVIVVSRDFLVKNEKVVDQVIQAYFSANFELSDKAKLVAADAQKSGDPLTPERAKDVAAGIRWRNTQENYAHFGLAQQPGYLHMEDIINNITRILVQSGSIKSDPTNSQPNLLYYDKVMKRLFESNYHPGSMVERVQSETQAAQLTEDQWKSLIPVGTMQVRPLTFARGTTRLSLGSEEILAVLAEKLKTWPSYHIGVSGNSFSPEDNEVNRQVANGRGDSIRKYLIDHGVSVNRIRVLPPELGVKHTRIQLLQQPY